MWSALESRNLSAASWRFSQSRASRSRTPQDTTSCTSCPPRRASPASASPRGAGRAGRVVAASADPSGRPGVVPGGFVPASKPSAFPAFPPRGAPRRALEARSRGLRPRVRRRGPRRGGEDEPDRDEDGLYIGTYSNFFTDPDQIKGVIIFCAFLASFASLGNIGAAILLPILYGQPIESCIQGILFGYYCPP